MEVFVAAGTMNEPLLEDRNSVAIQIEKSYFDVLGICCSSEVALVENILKSFNGIKDFSVIVPTKTLIVLHDTLLVSQNQIVEALNQARLEANVRTYGRVNEQNKWPNPFIIACALLYLFSFLQYVYHPLRWLALLSVVVGIFPLVKKGFTSIRNFNIDISILVLISVIGTIAMADYTEAATIVSLFTIAEWLESRASHKASSVMQSLTQIVPQKAVMAETGEEVDVGKVKLNSIIAVKAGDYIAIDGIVVDGECEVDEASLTGESFPIVKQLDSLVMAGTINLNGYISVKTTALAEDCVVSQIAKLVEESQNTKTKTQRLIDKCVQIYTPVVITISACIAVIPAVLRVDNHNHWFRLALVVLVSACPCALVLSTPVAIFCALTKAATSGLLIKGGDYLEILAKIKIMAFDKTGTLTRGEFVVKDFQSLCDDISLNSLVYWVSSIEARSSHPVAAALVGYGRSRFIKPNPEDVEEFHNYPGIGIHGRIEGRDIYIGNRKIVLRAGGKTGDSEKGKTMGYIYAGTSLVGIFSVSDTCRSGAMEAVKDLKLLGIKTVILTGDCNAAVMHVKQQLGNTIELAHAELLPEDKATYIEGFKKEGLTAMIGDGINDAPALAMADIGISMGISGSALATETGNMILMSNDLRVIPQSIQLARKARRTVIENTILSFSIKAVVLVFAIAGHPLVWAAVLADAGTCLLVIFNSMLLLRQTHKPAANSSKVKIKCDAAKISTNNPRCCFEKEKNLKACLTETRASNCQSGLQNCCSKKRIKEESSETDKICTEPCVSKSQQKSFICNTGDTNQYSDTPEIKAKCCDQGKCDIVRIDVRSDVVDDLGCSGSKNINFLTDGSENSLAKKFNCSKDQVEDLWDFITEQHHHTTIDIPTDAEQILCVDFQESSPGKRELRTCCKK